MPGYASLEPCVLTRLQFEIIILPRFKVILQMLHDYLFGYFSYCDTKEPPRQEMSVPAPLSTMRKSLNQLARRTPLDTPHDLTWCHVRWTTRQNVHVILGHYPLHDSDLKHLTRLSHKIAYSFRDLSSQHFVAALRHPHKVILDLIHRIAPVPLVMPHLHSCSAFSQLKLTA